VTARINRSVVKGGDVCGGPPKLPYRHGSQNNVVISQRPVRIRKDKRRLQPEIAETPPR
jgi:hypothetical protein